MPPTEMLLAARAAGLRYVDPSDPGIVRIRRGDTFAYREASGKVVRDAESIGRIRALAIPPAWEDVWISPSPDGHIQAVGRDARGRRQYRYHARWQQVRDESKYERTIAFARALPKLRRQVERDLRRRGLPREKVVAAAVRLLETTMIRVGNEEYARQNRSFGLTTLRDRHAKIKGETLKLTFRGKSGKDHEVGLRDRRLARVVKACQDLPGQRLFQYVDDDGRPQHIDSDDVNAYLRDAMGSEFSAKDFRTWAGTVLAARAFQELEEGGPSRLKSAVEEVAKKLGNTPAVCRKCYIHPQIIDAYLDGSLAQQMARRAAALEERGGLNAEERLVLNVLKKRLAADTRRAARRGVSTKAA
jgi:DNA topoisomerase-1